LSHLRWDFVFQRPQHLLTRAANTYHVIYVEEPKWDSAVDRLDVRTESPRITILIPRLSSVEPHRAVRALLEGYFRDHGIGEYVLWYYTPMALAYSDHLSPAAIVYDCMDELSAFAGASPELPAAEQRLLARADVVFTGGYSLYQAKRRLHHNVHLFPSGVDLAHFASARSLRRDPPDQQVIPHPRIGFFGVLDERLDRQLLEDVASRTPGWHYICVGPVAKIDARDLPRAANLHYLGAKRYEELPRYIAGWDVAMMPFAINEATRFISPTKTPEYLAAGRPVVSTPIEDVVSGYRNSGFVRIGATAAEFIDGIREALGTQLDMDRVDKYLSGHSWDAIWLRMSERLRGAILARRAARDSREDLRPMRTTNV
jgi:UDP-galactopyranose mutase